MHPFSLAAVAGLSAAVARLVIASLATSQTGSRIGSALIGTAVLLLAAVALGILGF